MMGLSLVDKIKQRYGAMQNEMEEFEKKLVVLDDDIAIEITEKAKAEADVAAMTRRIRLIEEDFEQSSGRLNEVSGKLEDASKAAEESERVCKKLHTVQVASEKRIEEVETAIYAAKVAADEADRKYEETARKFTLTTQTLATTKDRAKQYEDHAAQMEDKLKEVASQLKTFEIKRNQAAELEEAYTARIVALSKQLNEAASRAEAAEAAARRHVMEIQRAKDTLTIENRNYDILRKEMDSMLSEFHSI